MRSLLVFAALSVAGPIAAQDVAIDYAKDMQFKNVRTFQYVAPKATGSDSPLQAQRIIELIKLKLVRAGLSETKQSPDLYVTYHLTTEQNPKLNEADLEYGGFAQGWASWGGKGAPTDRVSLTGPGTLIIDAYRSSDKKLVWRGTGVLTNAKSGIDRNKQLERIFDELGKRWRRILRDAGQ